MLDDDLKKILANEYVQQPVRTSFAGSSTIRLPSRSRIVFSRRSKTLSKMTCTISTALGSRFKNGSYGRSIGQEDSQTAVA